MVGRKNYSGNTVATVHTLIAPQNASRTSIYVKNLSSSADIAVEFSNDASDNFSSTATYEKVTLKPNDSLVVTNSHKEPIDVRSNIFIYSSASDAFEFIVEEMSN